MPNGVKYSTTTPSGSLRRDNVALGVTGNLGPTANTEFYSMPTPVSGKYIINKVAASGVPNFFAPQNNTELIQFARNEGATGANTGSAAAVLAWIATQANLEAANIEYENIVTSGSVLNLDAGFVGSYPTTASNWYDLSGNNNNCTLVNGPIYTTSGSGGIKFDATDDYATIPDNNSLDLTELTISLWFNRGDILTLAAGDQQNFFIKGNTSAPGGDNFNYAVQLFGPTGGGRYAWQSPGIGFGALTPPSQVLFANQWYNLVFTHVSTNTPIAYLNGIKQTNWTATNPTNALVTNTWRATISGDVERNQAATFNGIMSIVQLYNRALSETEVLQNWNALKGRFGL